MVIVERDPKTGRAFTTKEKKTKTMRLTPTEVKMIQKRRHLINRISFKNRIHLVTLTNEEWDIIKLDRMKMPSRPTIDTINS